MNDINALWHSTSEAQWRGALEKYHQYITKSEVASLDKELDPLDLNEIAQLNSEQWFRFLYQKYFPWKYTAPNRLATTRASLAKHRNRPNGLSDLNRIKEELITAPVNNIEACLRLATEIGGLGIAGGSGLLALMHPAQFGTVDEFVVLALAEVQGLPEGQKLKEMAIRINESKKPKGKAFSISLRAGVLLIGILRRKAAENNERFNSSSWTPRKIDKVLWAFGHL